MKLKKSRFNYQFKSKNGDNVIYNPLSGVFARIRDSELLKVQSLLENPECDSNGVLMEQIIRGRFVIDKEIDELIFLQSIVAKSLNSNILAITVMPTLNCNFQCPYCYQGHEHPKEVMSIDTANGIKRFVENKIASGVESVRLGWFGGEPLLCFDLMKYLSMEIIGLCNRSDISFSSSLTTNGYLLDREKVEVIVREMKISQIQVTIDGPEATHNEYRPLRNGGKSFHVVFSNLALLLKEIASNGSVSVTLRINYDESSYNEVSKLLDMLPNEARGKINIYFKKIFGAEVSKSNRNVQDVENIQYLDPGSSATELSIEALNKGYKTERLGSVFTTFFCPADFVNYLEISPNGEIRKCGVGAEMKPIGCITDSGILLDPGEHERWVSKDTFQNNECISCEVLPFCMGGCKYVNLKSNNSRGCSEMLGNLTATLDLMYLNNLRSISGA